MRFSCGMTLSRIPITGTPNLAFSHLQMVPRAGPMNGIQNRTTIKSGFNLAICRTAFHQLIGFMELIEGTILTPSGPNRSEASVWDVPGNKKDGYCR